MSMHKENKHSCEAIVKWAPVFGNALICGVGFHHKDHNKDYEEFFK
jgi:hypothetical protein